VARLQAVTVEKARDHVVSRDQRQRADGVNDVGGGAGALPASAARQSVLSVGASHPVQGQYDLSRAVVEIGDSFVDEGAYDPFLEPRVRRRGRPDRLEVLGERVERDGRKGGTGRGRIMVGDARLAGGHADQGAVPARLELAGDKAVLGIGRVILPEGAIGRVARRLEVADQGLARFVALRGRLRLGGPRRLHRGRLHDG
jgi:hypothetical protein